jgi:hypothetical protein
VLHAILDHHNKSWSIESNQTITHGSIAMCIGIDKERLRRTHSYELIISSGCIDLMATDPAGIFYGVQTLCQIIKQSQTGHIPCLKITDWPDFPTRGVMLDISRDKVYQMHTLYDLIDKLASWKINQLQLYTEHTFAYQGHEKVWRNASPMTPEEIQNLDQYCKERFIELIPNQNSFGHMHRWLKHPEYQHLAETTEPFQTPWGKILYEPFSLAPTISESYEFIMGLYDQLLPNFSHKMINVGCDETFDLGAGRSKDACHSKGKGRVYLEYLLALYSNLSQRGYRMQFWGDIILKYPELIPELPGDVIALDWGYEHDHPFEKDTRLFRDAGIPYYVCPGTSSWNSIGGRVNNMRENIRNASDFGLLNGAQGLLNTDWGDYGHWQQLPVSYPGLVCGAAFSWCFENNQKIDLADALNRVVFMDDRKIMGNILIEIGNVYQDLKILPPNSSIIFWMLQEKTIDQPKFRELSRETLLKTNEKLNNLLSKLEGCNMKIKDAALIQQEIRLTINLMIHACKRGLFVLHNDKTTTSSQMLREIRNLIEEFRQTWLARNRIGGLSDSLHRFIPMIKSYK